VRQSCAKAVQVAVELLLLSALGATPQELHGKILNLEPLQFLLGERYLIEFFVVDVQNSTTRPADQMMVALGFAVKSACNAGKVDAADDAPLQERIQGSVNGGPGKLWKALLHGREDLVRGGMIVPPQNGFQNHPPLHGDGNTLLAAKLCEFFELLFDCFGLHIITSW
jgi:hypothetical protein